MYETNSENQRRHRLLWAHMDAIDMLQVIVHLTVVAIKPKDLTRVTNHTVMLALLFGASS